ncbi:rod shape-determining protein MreC [Thermus filiformis]|uniref:Cell shape-determining protein MreC n=1 Tax=Thermus filiformis TaxID=276 RepID=A0A0A2X8Y4_THEFI|nr:rod shape-determining protein MreC [Thermus filiformis]KGQ21649.2 rod shape-determining protein MreC [Thermus filiformis]
MSENLLRRGLFLLLLLLSLALASLTRPTALALSAEVSARTAPLLALGHRLGQNLRAAGAALVDRRDLRAENRALRAALEAERSENARLRLEVERLRRALAVKEAQAPGVVAVAPVIGEDQSGLFRRLILGLGERDGLRVGMPVTAPQGLVGLIVETTEKTAVVRTILDPESRVGVRPENAPGRGVAQGFPPDRLLAEFPPQVELAPGERLLTGTPLGLFPDGIPVARVERVERVEGGLKKRVLARPLVELSLLEEVVVLRPL